MRVLLLPSERHLMLPNFGFVLDFFHGTFGIRLLDTFLFNVDTLHGPKPPIIPSFYGHWTLAFFLHCLVEMNSFS